MKRKFIGKETKNTMINAVKNLKGVILPVVGVVLSSITISDLLDAIRYCGDVGYDDAIKAITNSNMMSSYKTEAITILKREQTSEYYRAVISTVNSNMMSSYKIDAMRNMSKTE